MINTTLWYSRNLANQYHHIHTFLQFTFPNSILIGPNSLYVSAVSKVLRDSLQTQDRGDATVLTINCINRGCIIHHN